MKRIPFFLILAFCCLSLSGCDAKPAADPSAPAAESDNRIRLPDFTVDTSDGGTFSLYETLKTKQKVFINLWATWCGYCTMEFPHLQEAAAQYQNDVAVICLSVEPQDTPDVIRAYAAQNGVSLPMGSAIGTGLEKYADNGVPVSIMADRNGYITAMEIGALPSAAAFAELFSRGAESDDEEQAKCAYKVYFADENGRPLSGCAVAFCAGESCVPVFGDENGTAVFEGAPETYAVKLISQPEGYTAGDLTEQTAGPYSQTLYFYLQKETP